MDNRIKTKIDNWNDELTKIRKYSKIDDCDLYRYYDTDKLNKLQTEYINKLNELNENIILKKQKLEEFQEMYNLIHNEIQIMDIKINLINKK